MTETPVRSARSGGRRIRNLDAGERRGRRRQQLLDATLDLVAAQGYAATSIEQICQAAFVSTKSFYELFDGKQSCYLALLDQLATAMAAPVMEVLADPPPTEAAAAADALAGFAHALVDDPRVARASFGEASGISPAVERQRRANRRNAAAIVTSLWELYGVRPSSPAVGRHVAVGIIGGLFDLVADWLHDAPADGGDIEVLIDALSHFYGAARAGL